MSEALIQALRQQVEGLKIAQSQSNQMVARLMGGALNDDQRRELFDLIIAHVNELERTRSAQLLAVMRTATMQLNSIAQSAEAALVQHDLVQIIKALTLTTECVSPQGKANERH